MLNLILINRLLFSAIETKANHFLPNKWYTERCEISGECARVLFTNELY